MVKRSALASEGALTLRSARCQSAYWHKGKLRVVNYLTRGVFAANPISLEVIGFFFSPKTMRDAMLEFDAYTPASVGEAILELIKAELLLECGSPEAAHDELVDSSWRPWLPSGGYHFLTKDAPYLTDYRSIGHRLPAIRRTPQPAKFKNIEGAERLTLPPPDGKGDSFFHTLHARRTWQDSRQRRHRWRALQSCCTRPGVCRGSSRRGPSARCRSKRALPGVRDIR